MEHITLYFKQGTSDKVYQATIEKRPAGYAVNFAFGRRGTTLTTGTKTPTAVNYDAAKAIYDKLVNEKTAKGYTVGENGTPYQHSEKTSTGIHCQLLNSVDEGQVERLIVDPAYWMQEKLDGRRLLIKKSGRALSGINRLGLVTGIPETIAFDIDRCPLDLIIDGEAVGDTFHAFDALLVGDDKLGDLGYGERYLRLMNLLASFQHRHISLVTCQFTTIQKSQALSELKAKGCEGVVFKHTHAPYTPGRPNAGGPQLKFKFVVTASFIVGSINNKRSIALQLLEENGRLVPSGNVTIPANHKIPAVDQVVECRYLYAFRESGSIFQPVYLGVRDDITTDECTTAQLKFKAEPTEVAA